MLVLTRKLQQQIKIGDQITVTILRVKGSTVRIGVQAPRDVRVVRGELPKDDGSDHTDSPLPSDSPSLTLEVTNLEPAAEATAAEPALAELPQAPHLPLRKNRGRRGPAPLKQMVATCTALAK